MNGGAKGVGWKSMGDDRWEVPESVENDRKEVDGGKEWLAVALGWEKGQSSSSSSLGVEWFGLQCTVLKRFGLKFIFVRVRWKTRRIVSFKPVLYFLFLMRRPRQIPLNPPAFANK